MGNPHNWTKQERREHWWASNGQAVIGFGLMLAFITVWLWCSL